MPRKSPPPPKGARKPLPAELARDAIAHEDEAPHGKVRMQAEALTARAIQEEKNLETLVAEILEAARKSKA